MNNKRSTWLDVFRGSTVALMILVNNPGSWSFVFTPFDHAAWNGCTLADLVFPFFLTAVGISLSFASTQWKTRPVWAVLSKITKRSFLIFFIGLFLNWCPFFKWEDQTLVFKHWVDPRNMDNGIRILGVLQRIAICFLTASVIILFFRKKTIAVIAVSILVVYWAVCLLGSRSPEPLSPEGFVGTQIDIAVLGLAHIYKGDGAMFDPEGLISHIPAVAHVLLGFIAGNFILKQRSQFPFRKLTGIAFFFLLVGIVWNLWFPINKKIWSSSYVCFTTGIALLIICILIYFLEVKKSDNRAIHLAEAMGKNALFIFMLSGFIPRLCGLIRLHNPPHSTTPYTTSIHWVYQTFFKTLFTNEKIDSLLFALFNVCLYTGIAYWMHQKKIYLKV